jgi:hypothetical protein
MLRSSEVSHSPHQTQFAFVAELPEQSTCIADYSVPDRVLREMALLADRMGHKAADAVADVLFRECSETFGETARRAITTGFLAERADRWRSFLEGLGLCRDTVLPDRYSPGSWTLSEKWGASGPVFIVGGIRSPEAGLTSARLEAKAFHRAASALRAIIRAIGPGDYAKPPAAEWRRIWHGERQDEAGLMAALLAGLKNHSTRVDERLVLVSYPKEDTRK